MPHDPKPDWKAIAKARGIAVPEGEIAEMSAILNNLLEETRAATSGDLTGVEPIGTFRIDDGEDASLR